MPNYEFICRDCRRIAEVKQSLADRDKGEKPVCPDCGSKNMTQFFGNSIVISRTHLH